MPIYEQVQTPQPEKEEVAAVEPEKSAEQSAEKTAEPKEKKVKTGLPTPHNVKKGIENFFKELSKPAPESQKNETVMIKTFDQFVNEAKKEKWIADLPMKKGALRKEMGKKKDEKISAKDIAKSEATLKKKDKDKKKPGLQLGAKDAKTHKRNVLAKNLMKASGAMHESKAEKIKGLKSDLVKIHEVVDRMIKQTTAKK